MKIKLIPILCILILGCDLPKDTSRHKYKWDVAICNSTGCNHYDCDTYTQNGDTYKLFCADTLTTQVTISIGVAVIISKQ